MSRVLFAAAATVACWPMFAQQDVGRIAAVLLLLMAAVACDFVAVCREQRDGEEG